MTELTAGTHNSKLIHLLNISSTNGACFTGWENELNVKPKLGTQLLQAISACVVSACVPFSQIITYLLI